MTPPEYVRLFGWIAVVAWAATFVSVTVWLRLWIRKHRGRG